MVATQVSRRSSAAAVHAGRPGSVRQISLALWCRPNRMSLRCGKRGTVVDVQTVYSILFLVMIELMYVRVALTLQHVSLLTLEGMIMPFLVLPTAVETNDVHVEDFHSPSPTTTAVETVDVRADDFLPPPSTTLEAF